jgi:hypothetical protein
MVLATPRTAVDRSSAERWPAIHPRVVIWLHRHGAGHPWSDQLALAAAVMLARRLDMATVLGYLRTVQTFFKTLFAHLDLTSIVEWDAGRAMRASLKCEVPEVRTLGQRLRFWSTHTSISNHEHIWLRRLPEVDRSRYEVFVLPRVDPRDFKGLVPRTAAHLRFNLILRVRAAYKQALQVLAERGPSVLPFEFTLDEGGDPERGALVRGMVARRVLGNCPVTGRFSSGMNDKLGFASGATRTRMDASTTAH